MKILELSHYFINLDGGLKVWHDSFRWSVQQLLKIRVIFELLVNRAVKNSIHIFQKLCVISLSFAPLFVHGYHVTFPFGNAHFVGWKLSWSRAADHHIILVFRIISDVVIKFVNLFLYQIFLEPAVAIALTFITAALFLLTYIFSHKFVNHILSQLINSLFWLIVVFLLILLLLSLSNLFLH